MNSTLQVLFGLDQALKLFNPNLKTQGKIEPLYESFLTTLNSLKKGDESISPLDFIMKLRNKFPVYAEKDKYGLYVQHDVHEFWSDLMTFIAANDPTVSKSINIILEKK